MITNTVYTNNATLNDSRTFRKEDLIPLNGKRKFSADLSTNLARGSLPSNKSKREEQLQSTNYYKVNSMKPPEIRKSSNLHTSINNQESIQSNGIPITEQESNYLKGPNNTSRSVSSSGVPIIELGHYVPPKRISALSKSVSNISTTKNTANSSIVNKTTMKTNTTENRLVKNDINSSSNYKNNVINNGRVNNNNNNNNKTKDNQTRSGPKQSFPINNNNNSHSSSNNNNGLRLVGDSLIDYQKLLKSSESNESHLKQSQQFLTDVLSKNQFNYKRNDNNQRYNNKNNNSNSNKKNMKEINENKALEELLNRKSIHEADAEDEWFDEYNNKLDKLSKREYAQDKASSIHSITVKAFVCVTCDNFLTESMPSFCHKNNHTINQITTIKKFFECRNCKLRENTFGNNIKIPMKKCKKCGVFDWIACGKLGSGPLSGKGGLAEMNQNISEIMTGDKLILSASEWTSYQDKIIMADKLGKL
eukprot:gene12678-16999_t